jgi:hypothetical protein
MLESGLEVGGDVIGAVELPSAAWTSQTLEVATFDGRIASVESTCGVWRMVA